MSYGGESIAKKLARYKVWTDILETPAFASQWADLGRFLVLCGPDRGDVTFLDAWLYCKAGMKTMLTKYRPDELIVAVDNDLGALENAIHLDEHNLFASAIYKSAQVDEVAQEYKREFSCIYLDFCSNISDRTLDTAARTIVKGLRNGGSFAMTVMMGRELEHIFTRISNPKKRLIAEMYDSTGAGREKPDLSEAALLRVEFLYRGLTDRLNSMGAGFLDMRGALSYMSSKYKRGTYSPGVPMLTMWWTFTRAPKQMRPYQYKKWSFFNAPLTSSVMLSTLPSGPECARELMDIVKFSRENHMATPIIERVLNVKFEIDPNSGKIAVYDWHTLAIEEDNAQFDITRETDDGNDSSGTA